MTRELFLKQIVAELEKAKKPASFFKCGSIDIVDPWIEVAGIGTLTFPIRIGDLRQLCQAAVQAPYGKRSETIIDREVRDTLEIPAHEVLCSQEFLEKLKAVVKSIASELYLEHERLECELYKLLLYTKGGFFLPHRDNEKKPGMVASMVVVLPNKFGGGDLIVQHDSYGCRFAFEEARRQKKAEFVAFFADCKHEVKKVTSGVRVCLTFNLILKDEPKQKIQAVRKSNAKLLESIEGWMTHRADRPIVFALEHLYTNDGLAPQLLKGADLILFEELVPVVEELDCSLHFGQVSRHLCQFADDGSYEYWRRSSRRFPHDHNRLTIGETYEDEIVIDGWKDIGGVSERFPNLPCESGQLISATPVEQWIPTSQDYEGYTGNAGNTLDRWYHKSAIVIWPNSQHFQVITQMGLDYAIKEFLKLFSDRSKRKGSRLTKATAECVALARAIIHKWPDGRRFASNRDEVDSLHVDFSEVLPQLEDAELVGEFLQMIARRDRNLDLTKLIEESWLSLGSDITLSHIKTFLLYEPQPNEYGIIFNAGLASRDIELLYTLSRNHQYTQMAGFSDLLALACEKLARQLQRLTTENSRVQTELPKSGWLQLILASWNAGVESRQRELLQLADEYPKILGLREVQVPVALELKNLERNSGGKLPEPLGDWIKSVRQKLEVATQTKPQPPQDQTRSANMICKCEYCNQLSDFLRNPEQSQFEIKAPEHYRYHLEDIVRNRLLDLTGETIRVGNRYAIRFVKTIASHQKALQRYEDDLQLLAKLESAGF